MPDIAPPLMLRTLSGAVEQISDGPRKRRQQDLLKNLRGMEFSWRDGDQCYFPQCEEAAIKASHTVQKASMRNHFGEKCVTPLWSEGRFAVVTKHIKSISTFPGYCLEHEKAFEFESRGHFIAERDDVLQIMRTVHREIWLTRCRTEFIEKLLFAIRNTSEALLQEGKSNLPETSALMAQAQKLKDFALLQRTMLVRLNPLAKKLSAVALGEASLETAAVIADDIPKQPFVFHSAVKLGDEAAALLAIALVYNGEKSRLITAIEPDFEPYNTSYWTQFLSNDDDVNGTLDAWLRDGTLDWYADPVWWNNISHADRQSLEEAVNSGF